MLKNIIVTWLKNSYQFLTHNEQGICYPLDKTAILIHRLGYTATHEKEWKRTENIAYLYN